MEFPMTAMAAVISAAASIIAWHFNCRKRSAPLNWPVVGMMPALLWNIHNIYDYASKLVVHNGGTFKFRGPWMTRDLFELVTSNPANLEYILKKDFSNFPSGPHLKEAFFDMFGDGLFTADDELWKRQRKAVGMALASATFRDRNSFLLHKMVQEKLLPALQLATENRTDIDLQDILLRFNFDNICMNVLGRDPGCLGDENLPTKDSFARAFDEAIESCTYRLMVPSLIWKFMRFLNVGFEKKLGKALAIIGEFTAEMVEGRIKQIEAEGGSKGDILSNFIEMETDEGRSPSLKLLQELILSIFLAGRDTTAISLSWFFWLVSMHPNVERKIVSEISQILKSKLLENNINEMGLFDIKDLRGMNYLQAALSDSMRLFPSVPVIYREAAKQNILPDGTHVRKGSKLLCFIYATGHMESLWGKDALEFVPERWINEVGLCVKEWDCKFPVFNAGPRACLGRDIAYVSMKFMAANILARYQLKLCSAHPVKPKFGLTLTMKHGLRVTLDSRKNIV
ncbi:hypothetical protein KI387_016213 [Taxus chinensis]|uniref:Cytochrome P450 n=1 Tax=Taxus chinensis TaxID=29808 RepID=A0AA38LEJ6_TAXCH|nr:hypothetical protein KI387_016213 [Taxus chinensis]